MGAARESLAGSDRWRRLAARPSAARDSGTPGGQARPRPGAGAFKDVSPARHGSTGRGGHCRQQAPLPAGCGAAGLPSVTGMSAAVPLVFQRPAARSRAARAVAAAASPGALPEEQRGQPPAVLETATCAVVLLIEASSMLLTVVDGSFATSRLSDLFVVEEVADPLPGGFLSRFSCSSFELLAAGPDAPDKVMVELAELAELAVRPRAPLDDEAARDFERVGAVSTEAGLGCQRRQPDLLQLEL